MAYQKLDTKDGVQLSLSYEEECSSSLEAYDINMTIKLLHHLLDVSSYVYEELTDTMGDYDISKSFWKHLKSKFLDDNTKKIKVSDYIREELFKIDVDVFNEKYSCKLQNIKKDKAQVSFVCSCVALMFQHSGVGESIIEWC